VNQAFPHQYLFIKNGCLKYTTLFEDFPNIVSYERFENEKGKNVDYIVVAGFLLDYYQAF